ncbi:MAG: hypothetical protein AAF648_00630 [Pseudomonadota bacterium]
MSRVGITGRVALIGLICALVALAWHGSVDRLAGGQTEALLTRALATFTLARSLNGAISVAQGTEIAVQPVGVGVTITAGQVLDPLNDLIERFSWLVLMASASLGVQTVLTQIFASLWLNLGLTLVASLGILALLWPRLPLRDWWLRLCALALFARFLIALVTLLTTLANSLFLAEREAIARAELERVSGIVESQNEVVLAESTEDTARDPDAGIMDRLGRYLGRQADALNVQQRLAALRESAEAAITGVINLIVIFVLQTVLFPLGALWLTVRSFQLLTSRLLLPASMAREPAQER